MLLSELQAAVYARTGVDSGLAAAVTSSLNDHYRELVRRFQLNPASVTLPLVAGTTTYDLGALIQTAVGQNDFDGLIELYLTDSGGNPSQLEQSDLSHIVKLRGAALTTGQPTDFAQIGLTGIELYPVPTSGYNFLCWYSRWRTATQPTGYVMAAGGDSPAFIPLAFHNILDLAASLDIASRYESLGANRTLKSDIAAEYDRRLAELAADIRQRQGKQTRRIRTGYRRFARIRPSVPSQDLGGRY